MKALGHHLPRTSAACNAASLKRGLFSNLYFSNFWWSSCWLADEEGFATRGAPPPSPLPAAAAAAAAAAAVAAKLPGCRLLADKVEGEEGAAANRELDGDGEVIELLLLLLLLLLRRVCRGMEAWRVGWSRTRRV